MLVSGVGLLGEGRVPGRLQLVGELGAALGDDLAAHEDVHLVRSQLGQQPVVVRDGEHAEAGLAVGRLGGRFDAARAGAQGVDVETGVELVEDGDPRPEHGELHRLVALALAAREVDVDRTMQEPLLEPDAAGLLEQEVVEPFDAPAARR